jgi:hypothetical protein
MQSEAQVSKRSQTHRRKSVDARKMGLANLKEPESLGFVKYIEERHFPALGCPGWLQ